MNDPTPPPFEPAALERSLDRYLTSGLVFMVVLIAGFVAYRVREPTLRADADGAAADLVQAIGTRAVRDELRVVPRQGRRTAAARRC